MQAHNDPEVYDLPSFARAHGMARSRLYELLEIGCGPAVTANGRRKIVTREAAEEWRREWTGKSLPSRPRREIEEDRR
jgi:hypothetical protein